VVYVPGDPGLVEDQQAVGPIEHASHLLDQDIERHASKPAIGVIQQMQAPYAENVAGCLQFTRADVCQILTRAQGGCLAARVAQDVDTGSTIEQGGDDPAKSERLVVGMGHDGENPAERG